MSQMPITPNKRRMSHRRLSPQVIRRRRRLGNLRNITNDNLSDNQINSGQAVPDNEINSGQAVHAPHIVNNNQLENNRLADQNNPIVHSSDDDIDPPQPGYPHQLPNANLQVPDNPIPPNMPDCNDILAVEEQLQFSDSDDDLFHDILDPQSLTDPQFLNLRRTFLDQLANITQSVCVYCNEKHFVTTNENSCRRCRQSHPSYTPSQLADICISKFANTAKVVVFCSVVDRTKPRGMSAQTFSRLADEYNARLFDRLKDKSHHLYWRHNSNLKTKIASDGVHLCGDGLLKFGLSIRAAIIKGLRLF
jgi:hypothetical protein